jgi:sodium transport system permease protein
MLSPGGTDLFAYNSLEAGAISFSALITIVLVLFSAALFTGSIVALLGSLARSVKEGTTYVMPLYMLVILIGVITMYMDPTENGWFFFIPIVNTIFVMKEIFMGMVTPWHVVVTLLTQIGCSGVCAYLVARLFNSEKILQTV